MNANADNGLNVDGWTKIGTYYRMERSVGDSYYVVTITITNTILPIIESRGFCRMPLLVQNNSGPFFLAMPQGYTSPRQGYVGRGVRIKTRRNGSLTKAMLSKGKIDIGGAVNVDSFNSCDPTMSTGGQYDATKAGDGGDIASNGQLVKEISASGNVKIKGHVSTGPGGTTGIDGSVSVGNAAWVDGGNTGVQTGWFRDDMNATIPDAPVAPTGGYTTLNPGGTVNGVYYDSILTSGTYVINGSLSLNSQQQVLVTGDVILVVKNNLSVGGQAQIVIAPSGNLQLFCSGNDASIAGGGLVNQSTDPHRFTYYGTKTNNKLSLAGSADFYGVIYAPYTDLTVAGGAVIYGGTVSQSVKATGGFTLHYDQCLSNGGQGRYIVTQWDEMLPQEVAQVP